MKKTHEGSECVPTSETVDMNSMLMFLAKQLEMTVEQSHGDYDVISHFCLEKINDGSENISLVKAMQSYDLSYQRIQYVISLIERLIDLDDSTHMVKPDAKLLTEFNRICSFYNEHQTSDLLDVLPIQSTQCCWRSDVHDDDMELF